MDVLEYLLDALIGVLVLFALIPTIFLSANGTSWAAVNLGGTVYDLAWVPFVIIILIVIGVVYIFYRHTKGGKK